MSEYTLGLAASPFVVLPIIAAAFAYAVYTYRHTSPPVSAARRRTLIALRTFGIALLLIAIFEPVLTLLGVRAEEPIVVVAVDNSASMALQGLDSVRSREALAIARRIAESDLGTSSRIVVFSDSATSVPGVDSLARLSSNGVATRLDAPFSMVADSLRRRNIRAIVLLSDGRYNTGSNPIFAAEGLGIPVYAVGIGDSVEPRDISVQQIFTNEVAWLGTELPVEVRVKSAGFQNGRATVTLRSEQGVVASQEVAITPGTNEYTLSFTWRPQREGMARLTATVSSAAGGTELTQKNNARSAYVRVRPNKRSYILIAGGPNPDAAFLRRLLAGNPAIEVKTYIEGGTGGFIEGELNAAAFRDAEAVVLVDFPTSATSDATLSTVRSAVVGGNIPLLVVLGNRVDFTRLRTLESLLPVTLGVQRGAELQVVPEITPDGRTSPITRVQDMSVWDRLPPLFTTESSINVRPESEVLVRGRLGNSAVNEPLIVSRRLGSSRSVMFLGYGIYRWKLYGEGTAAAHGDSASGLLGDLLGNSLRWLAVAGDERQVRIVSGKPIYNSGETVRILAQVYNESYDPVNDATVKVGVVGPERNYTLVLAALGSGRYEGTISNLPSGEYGFSGDARNASGILGSDAGRFSIGETELELLQPSMNAELLRALATHTGGRFYTPRTSAALISDISTAKSFAARSIESRRDIPLWSTPWVLALALLAFSSEWYLRKRSGML